MTNFKECSMSKEGILMNLRKGLESEYRAKELCELVSVLLEDAEDKAKVLRIIADEEKHIKITENLISITESFYTAEYDKK